MALTLPCEALREVFLYDIAQSHAGLARAGRSHEEEVVACLLDAQQHVVVVGMVGA